jgi:purine-binding chemotaxis protein CheW
VIENDSRDNDQQMLVSTFYLGEAAFGLDTAYIQEVVRVADITPVHHAPAYLLGVMNLRGRIATVIDLGLKLELGRTEIKENSRILILECEGEQIGLMVEYVADAISIDRADIKPSPENVRRVQGRYVKGVFETEERLIALLDTSAVLAMEDGQEGTW